VIRVFPFILISQVHLNFCEYIEAQDKGNYVTPPHEILPPFLTPVSYPRFLACLFNWNVRFLSGLECYLLDCLSVTLTKDRSHCTVMFINLSIFQCFRGGRRNEQFPDITGSVCCVFFLLLKEGGYMETTEQLEKQESHTQLAENEEANEGKASKRNKSYELAEARSYTERNADVDYKIMLALYEHRALTPTQVKKVWFPEAHENSIRNRMKALAERKILTVNLRAGIKSRPIHIYSLSTFGLRILTENVLEVMEYEPKLDERKQHYTVDDLKVRHQHNHHYELQEWVIDVLSKRSDLLHCEWRRFPFIEEKEEPVQVRPDWLFVEVDKETMSVIEETPANNPLLYPYHYRKEEFGGLNYKPLLCVECDRGTMNRSELVEKWESYRKLPQEYKPEAIAVFHNPSKNGETRHRSIRDTLSYSFELEVIQNEIQLFQGDHQLSQDSVSLYFERDRDLLKGKEMTNEKVLIKLVEPYSEELKEGEAAVLDIDKAIDRFKLPVRPDSMIIKQKEEGSTLQLVFYALPGWVNPIIKIQALKRWLKEGHLSQFSDIQYILLYPDEGYQNDVRHTDNDVFYVSFQEVKEHGKWGKAHIEERKHKKVQWREVSL
jgi:hypothetical protein